MNNTSGLHLNLTGLYRLESIINGLRIPTSRLIIPSNTPQVRVGVGVFILESARKDHENPRFIIGKRINAHGAGSWALPGGHLHFGETPESCTAREVMEETGLKVKDVQFLTATNDFMPKEDRHYVTLFMVCVREDDWESPDVLELDKCETWEWICWEEFLEWVELQEEGREWQLADRKLFLPLVNLVKQRPGVRLALQ